MRAELRRCACAALVVAGACVPAGPARAQLSARLQVQFQRVEQDQPLPGGGVLTTRTSQFWLQTYELNHAMRFARATTVASQFKLTDLSYAGRPDANRTPFGSVRVTNPAFGLSAGHRPSTTIVSLEDNGVTREVTSKVQESFLNGYLSLPTGTRVDGLWSRRHRDPESTALEKTGVNRTLRASQSLGALSLHGGYTDLLEDAAGSDPTATQRTWNGGAEVGFVPRPGAVLHADYGFARSERLSVGRTHDLHTTHNASLNGTWLQSERVSWSGNYTFRALESRYQLATRSTTQDGSAQVTYRPNRLLHFTGAGGVRTLGGLASEDLLRFASATVFAGGDLRPGLNAIASVSQTANWARDAFFGSQTAYGALAWRVRQGIELRGDAQASANGDSTIGTSDVSSYTSVSVRLEPLRSFSFGYGTRNYRIGPALFDATGSARTHTMDLRWQPLPAVELSGARSISGAMPHDDPKLTTTSWILRLRPGAALQAWASLTRTDDRRRGAAVAEGLIGREIVTMRLIATLGRDMTLIGGMSIANRHRADEGRQYDASVTKRFGR